MSATITENVLEGLLAIHRYRFLSVDQFARASCLKASHVRDVLRTFERKSLLGSIGNVGLRGGAKAPKLYHLTRSGYAAMLEAGGLLEDEIGAYRKAHTANRWTPVMAHRLATIDLLLAAEEGLHAHARYRLVATFHEYRREKKGRHGDQPETSDFVAEEEVSENRIVPDAAFILENLETGTRGLFFIETDRGTERLSRGSPGGYSISDKFRLYERYLKGGRFAGTYSAYGSFRFFTVLFVTTTADRIANTRRVSAALDPELHAYFKLAPFEEAKDNFFHPIWWNRDARDPARAGLVKDYAPEPEGG